MDRRTFIKLLSGISLIGVPSRFHITPICIESPLTLSVRIPKNATDICVYNISEYTLHKISPSLLEIRLARAISDEELNDIEIFYSA